MLRRVEFMLEKANNVKLDFIVLSRTQTYLAHPFYYNSHAYKHIFKSIPLFIFGPRPGTLHINHNYFTYFFQVTRYCNIYLSRNVTLECLLFERKFSLSTLLFHLQTNSFSLLLTLFSTSFSMFFATVCVLTMRFFSNSNLTSL